MIACTVSKRITSKCLKNLLITETFETQTIRMRYRETSARIVNGKLLVVCLFKWYKVHFYYASEKTRVRKAELKELLLTNELFDDRINTITIQMTYRDFFLLFENKLLTILYV